MREIACGGGRGNEEKKSDEPSPNDSPPPLRGRVRAGGDTARCEGSKLGQTVTPRRNVRKL
jgi:hypothetical protein